MQLKQIRDLFDAGAVYGFTAVRAPMSDDGWLLTIQSKKANEKSWTLETALGQPRVFSSLDTLVRLVSQFGVNVSRIEFNY